MTYQTTNLDVFSKKWRLAAFIGCHIFALLWLGAFMTEAGFNLWRKFDSTVFFMLNGWLTNEFQINFWAWANVRASDIVPGIIILISLTFPIFGIERSKLQQALIGFILLLIWMLLVRQCLHEFISFISFNSSSPSLELSPVNRLSDLAPNIPAKDYSKSSFPGDHASILFVWTGFIFFNAGRKWGLLVALLSAAFMLPRLVGGAHWFSDNFVGGLYTAIITLAWGFCTPLFTQITKIVHSKLAPLIRLFAKIPLLNKLPILAED